MAAGKIKSQGIHYTPPELAEFLSRAICEHLGHRTGDLCVLDPACGDGALLYAFARVTPASLRCHLTLVGYETDADALQEARRLLSTVELSDLVLHNADFLAEVGNGPANAGDQLDLFAENGAGGVLAKFDAVIANPPYVRTQVLGAKRSRQLARQFDLTGRVDLYQAFSKAMASVLKPEGVLGLLTSNRFLTIKSGGALRRLLWRDFDLKAVFDLGDTKLFSAAVLPVIVVAQRSRGESGNKCRFDRVYEHRSDACEPAPVARFDSVIDALGNRGFEGLMQAPSGRFRVERGELLTKGNDDVWTLSTPRYARWLASVRARQACTFGDVVSIRVGIKTTADDVFIRERWDDLPANQRPEPELVHPLIRHFDARRWTWSACARQFVLYPHRSVDGVRKPIELALYPNTTSYFELHRERLSQRHYVIDGGRQWYEIWVPHNPLEWSKPKIVFPDISEEPRFFLDTTGAIVNGDCYWMTVRPGLATDWLPLTLAVANSSLTTRFYDLAFHNKLYAGRRRFMTQYVQNFPLPALDDAVTGRVVALAKQIIEAGHADDGLEDEIDNLVWESFGLVKEV